MTAGDVELFFHLLGVLSVFVGFGILLAATTALTRTTRVEQVRAIVAPLVAGRQVGPEHISVLDVVVVAGVLLIAATGVTMASAANRASSSWVDVATASFILLAPVGPFVINPRLHAIAAEAMGHDDGPLPSSLRARIDDRLLALAMRSSIAVLTGLVFLMTTKPAWPLSIAVVLVAGGLGAGSSLRFRRRS